ncbi:MAG: sulfite exporter TauE/SafE family protein [Tistlia sp.]|uniref:sulfite exporter TauE/SafE family protein n=1 Tax=Tistlia sp. TaxID=3057121 RepID=UPI0034A0F4C6
MIELPPLGELAWLAGAMVATGALAGVLAGLLGVGGGIVIVPVLSVILAVLGVEPEILMHVAVGTSLLTIVPTSIASARAHARRGAVDWSLIRRWGATIVLGAILGGVAAAYLRSAELSLVFAAIALAVALFMLVRREGRPLFARLPGGPAGQPLPLLMGGISTLMGIGGGTLGVPLLSACAYPVRQAVATASVFGLLIAVPGSAGFVVAGWGHPDLPPFSLGYPNLLGLVCIAPLTILFAPLGARLAHSIRPGLLRVLFAVFLILTSAKMLLGALGVF